MEKITEFCLVLINVNCFVPRKQNFLVGKLVKNSFFFFWISDQSFIEDEKFFMFAMMNTKYLKKITRSYRRSKSVLEPKNRGKMCKTPCPRANKQGTNQQGFHLIERPQHPRTYNYSVTSTLSTSRMLAPDSILPLKKW